MYTIQPRKVSLSTHVRAMCIHKHLHPPAQLRLSLDQARTATAQGAVPPAQPLPRAPHLLLSRAQSRFWALLFIGQSCLVHVCRFSRILSTLRDRLQDVPKPGPFTKIAHPGSTCYFREIRHTGHPGWPGGLGRPVGNAAGRVICYGPCVRLVPRGA